MTCKKYEFNSEQINFIKEVLGIEWDVPNNVFVLSDDEVCEIVEKSTIRLMEHGFINDEPTYDGTMCESIVDILGDYR